MTLISDAKLQKVPVVLLDGPMDGQRFKVPMLPRQYKVPDSLDLPLKQPSSSSPFAQYKLSSDEPVGGLYVYFFAGCSSPDGEGVLYAPNFAAASTSSALDLISQNTGIA